MKYSITATIPTVQYGNLQPCIEVEAETFEEANAIAMPKIEALWAQYCEDGKQLPKNTQKANRQLVEAFVGGSIYYDADAHVYTNEQGDIYLSGSQYAKQFSKPFNTEQISGAMGVRNGVKAEDIRAMWKLKAEVSSGFGTAIHAALELYGKYGELATKLGKTTHLHDHPTINKIVKEFYASREKEKAVYEAMIVDHTEKRAGQVDRLLVTGGKRCRIQDFKFNAVMTDDKLKEYWQQLKFYGGIMFANGWTVEGYDIFHNDGEWHLYAREVAV